MNTTIEITPQARQALDELAEATGDPPPVVLNHAVEEYRRRTFLKGLAADFDALRADPQAWANERSERAEWDAVVAADVGVNP